MLHFTTQGSARVRGLALGGSSASPYPVRTRTECPAALPRDRHLREVTLCHACSA